VGNWLPAMGPNVSGWRKIWAGGGEVPGQRRGCSAKPNAVGGVLEDLWGLRWVALAALQLSKWPKSS